MRQNQQPPVAQRRPVIREHHGDRFIDDYEWLRDKQSPDVIAHLEAENAWTEQHLAPLQPLVDEIYGDIVARTQQTDLAVPAFERHSGGDGDGWWYYTRTLEGKDYPLFCRVPDNGAGRPQLDQAVEGEQVLLDGNAAAEGHEFFSLGAFSVSPDGRLLAWSVDHSGDERYQLFVRDLASGNDFGPVLSDLASGICWAGDEHLFYTRVDAAWRPHQVWRHRLRTEPSDDVLVLQEDDERYFLSVDESRDRQQLVFWAASKLTSEIRLLSTATPEGTPRLVAPRRDGVDYQVEVAGDRLLVLHNANHPDFELAWAPLDATGMDQWQTLVEPREGVRLESVDAYERFVVLQGRRDGLSAVGVCARDTQGNPGELRWLEFDEPVHEVGARSEPDWQATAVRVNYTSLVTPNSVLEWDLASNSTTLLKRTGVLDHPVHGAYDPTDYVQERLWATADDGTRVPISLVRRKDVVADGTAPCLLYGYGSYEASMAPAFVTSRLSLLDRGIVFAIAHVRGGGEMGRHWYDQGKQLTKRNTFTDFVACAHHLIELGWTAPDRLAAEGRSAGGLLMGAITNLAPGTFRAVHAGVPFVDALNSILMPDLPLTVVEWEEWGNPLADKDVYAYMKSYSPYENITAAEYPAILATTSLNDTRVLYVEPAKWVAKLRETVTNGPDRPVLLRTEMVAGHGGASGRYAAWKERAVELAWLVDQITPRN